MMVSANPLHIKPYTSIRVHQEDFIARTNQKHGLLHFHDLDTWIRSAVQKSSVHDLISVCTKSALTIKINAEFQSWTLES